MRLLILFVLTISLLCCSSNSIKCGDLLLIYGKKPPELEFIDCYRGQGQVKIYAKYKVSGQHSLSVEKFLINEYGIGKLKFNCCGWESEDGKMGSLKNEDLKKINPNYQITIKMFGSAEIKNKLKTVVQKERMKVDYFYVIVELVEV